MTRGCLLYCVASQEEKMLLAMVSFDRRVPEGMDSVARQSRYMFRQAESPI